MPDWPARRCLGALVALSATLALGCGSSTDRITATADRAEDRAAPSTPHAIASIAAVESQQRHAFAILRTLPEGLPVVVMRLLRRPSFGANWGLAQRLPLNERA